MINKENSLNIVHMKRCVKYIQTFSSDWATPVSSLSRLGLKFIVAVIFCCLKMNSLVLTCCLIAISVTDDVAPHFVWVLIIFALFVHEAHLLYYQLQIQFPNDKLFLPADSPVLSLSIRWLIIFNLIVCVDKEECR